MFLQRVFEFGFCHTYDALCDKLYLVYHPYVSFLSIVYVDRC